MDHPSICYYVSDHGMGHAARSIAVIRSIKEKWNHAKIFVKTAGPYAFMHDSLPLCTHIRTSNDIGPILFSGRPVVDHERTEVLFQSWLNTWDAYILREKQFCTEHSIDCIISDIAPQPFLLAESLSIPGIAISNFSWHLVFADLFGRTPETERLRDAYASCTYALVLPFHESMEIFPQKKEVGLITRQVTMDKQSVRRSLGINHNDRLIHVGSGAEMPSTLLHALREKKIKNLKILVSSNIPQYHDNIISIPKGETETQNYLSACDLIVAKCGYSTISEAVNADIPLLLYRREGFAEDKYLIDHVTENGCGREISWQYFIDGRWISAPLTKYNDGDINGTHEILHSNGTEDVNSVLCDFL